MQVTVQKQYISLYFRNIWSIGNGLFIIIELYIFELAKLAKSRRMEEDSNYFMRACKTGRAHLCSHFPSNSDPDSDLLGKVCRCFLTTESENGLVWKVPLESNTPCSSSNSYSLLPRPMFRWLLKVSKDADSTTSLGKLCQCSVTCRVKNCSLVFRGSLLCFCLFLLPLALSPGTSEESLCRGYSHDGLSTWVKQGLKTDVICCTRPTGIVGK